MVLPAAESRHANDSSPAQWSGESRSVNRLQGLARYLVFAFRALLELPLSFGQAREFLGQLYNILLGALPLASAAGVALGIVVWMHLRGVLSEIGGPGAIVYLPQGLALAVVLEFAPVSAGLISAGRSGAALAAELGAMRLTEQIDALQVLGSSPFRKLAVPRIAACTVSLPLLTVFIAYLAIGSGLLAESIGGSMTATQFVSESLRVLTLKNAVPATLKTLFFGFWIGVTGCYCGMYATGGTEGIGKAATRGVVLSIFLVLSSNVILVRLIQLLT
jgi:phospholipid/cholesterol/gamma-HCH transport system permease protein